MTRMDDFYNSLKPYTADDIDWLEENDYIEFIHGELCLYYVTTKPHMLDSSLLAEGDCFRYDTQDHTIHFEPRNKDYDNKHHE